MNRLLRPYGVVIDGFLEIGLELVIDQGRIAEIRPHTGIPDEFIVSPAFVNAHSHLEYRGLQGRLHAPDYWPWIREITEAKRAQTPDQVQEDAILAARENRKTGVALIAEHSDRPVSGRAIREAGLQGALFQEVITRFEKDGPDERVDRAEKDRGRQGLVANVPPFLAPHAYQTVDEGTLSAIAGSGKPFSMHVAETDLENQLALYGTGAIAETLADFGVPYRPTGKRLIETLEDLGLVRAGAQFVHCCAIEADEVKLLADRGVSIAHCPRSNVRLKCPSAPIREMLDAGIPVGLGLDSAASSGPIDMFDEMRCALRVSESRGKALSPEEVWSMATSRGAESLRFALPNLGSWEIQVGSDVPLIGIHIAEAFTIEHVIDRGSPESVEFL